MRQIIFFVVFLPLFFNIAYGDDVESLFEKIASKDVLAKYSSLLFDNGCHPALIGWDKECIKPSFDCKKAKPNTSEWLLCYAEQNAFMDNLFDSLYNFIRQNIPKEQISQIKIIAKETIKRRDKGVGNKINVANENLDNLNRLASEGFNKNDDEITDEQREARMILSLYGRRLENPYQGIVWQIDDAYFRGVCNLSRYLLDKHPKLFARMFSKHTQEYKEILLFKFDDEIVDFRVIEMFLGALYFDKIIDETGKIAVR